MEFYTVHLDEVRKIIGDSKEFVESDRGDHITFDYVVCMKDTFPPIKTREDAIRRECRGIIFNKTTGEVIRRPFHKFFNVDEREETFTENLNFRQKYIILEKLDGSMVAPFYSEGIVRWGTKLGITEPFTVMIEDFIAANPDMKYQEFAESMIGLGLTPIFEWCSRRTRIVVDHPEDKLVLTSLRNINSGKYHSHLAMGEFAKMANIPYVTAFQNDLEEDFIGFVEEMKVETGMEGYVIRFEDGTMVKLKNDWYTQLHRAKDSLGHEKNVWKIILEKNDDDLVSNLIDDDRTAFIEFRDMFNENFQTTVNDTVEWCEQVMTKCESKKDFALIVMDELHPNKRSLAFAIFDKKDPHEYMRDYLIRKCKSATTIEEARPILYYIKWDDYYRSDYA